MGRNTMNRRITTLGRSSLFFRLHNQNPHEAQLARCRLPLAPLVVSTAGFSHITNKCTRGHTLLEPKVAQCMPPRSISYDSLKIPQIILCSLRSEQGRINHTAFLGFSPGPRGFKGPTANSSNPTASNTLLQYFYFRMRDLDLKPPALVQCGSGSTTLGCRCDDDDRGRQLNVLSEARS
ncbi:hypothetical protein EVAR_87275_1 [Eumeta japonica]|uniref:Uncharacterized protein n=1 Tax=Eumeta variegata TaxID=151549 RepID=A0A4C1VUM6_EUMVA|nr:hypothetical protein EVAR_87275_1 [Eumeta japonica]